MSPRSSKVRPRSRRAEQVLRADVDRRAVVRRHQDQGVPVRRVHLVAQHAAAAPLPTSSSCAGPRCAPWDRRDGCLAPAARVRVSLRCRPRNWSRRRRSAGCPGSGTAQKPSPPRRRDHSSLRIPLDVQLALGPPMQPLSCRPPLYVVGADSVVDANAVVLRDGERLHIRATSGRGHTDADPAVIQLDDMA